eukprot:COSAG02_NODE_4866_length_4884_cov_2782.941902_5_plen_109_part_00
MHTSALTCAGCLCVYLHVKLAQVTDNTVGLQGQLSSWRNHDSTSACQPREYSRFHKDDRQPAAEMRGFARGTVGRTISRFEATFDHHLDCGDEKRQRLPPSSFCLGSQ